jgi:hypothetical protein
MRQIQSPTIHLICSQSAQLIVEQDARGTEFGNGITAAAEYGGGNGTQASPYQINNARQLKKLVDEGNAYGYFKLNTDIEVTAYEWIPIGYFRGTFDGGGHTISGTMRSSQYSYLEMVLLPSSWIVS